MSETDHVKFIESDTELANYLTSGQIVVARFYQRNCEHCEKTEKVFYQLAADMSKDAIVFLDVDVGGLNLWTIFRSKVFSLPTIEIWRDSALVAKLASVDEDKVRRLVAKAISESDSEDDSLSRSFTQSMSASTQFIASVGSHILQSAKGMLSRTGSLNAMDTEPVPHSHLASSPPSPKPNSPSFLKNAAQSLYNVWNSGSRAEMEDDWEQVEPEQVSIPLPTAVKSPRK
jgi:thiol-disulfide isomerase/thioredoxin